MVDISWPGNRSESVMQRLDWTAPPEEVSRELIHVEPDEPSDLDRPPLLFVHGASMGAWCWRRHWMPAAARRGWDTWAVSLRGHPDSGGRDRRGRWTFRHYVHDVLQAITELPAPPVLVGHSMGSIVVERALRRYAAPVAVQIAPAGDTNGLRTLLQLFGRRPTDAIRGLFGQSIPPRHDYLFSPTTDPDSTRADRVKTRAPTPLNQYELVLPKLGEPPRCPMVVIGMENDTLIPPGAVERFACRRDTDPIIIPRAGHTPHLEPDHWEDALEITLSAITATLDRLPRVTS